MAKNHHSDTNYQNSHEVEGNYNMIRVKYYSQEKKESKMKSGWFKTRRFNAVLRVQHTTKSK